MLFFNKNEEQHNFLDSKKIKNNYNGITNKEGCWEYLIKYYEWSEKQGN